MLQLYSPAGGVVLDDVLADAVPSRGGFIVHSCCSDSRSVKPGDLFVALIGPDHDGHNFVGDAVSRGAVGVLAERPLPVNDIPVFVVPDTRSAYGRICQALVGWPSEELELIGVTGTSGKTTTAVLIASVLNMAGGRTGMLGTLGYTDGQTTAPAPHSTPPPPLLAKWFGQMVASFCTHAVVEVSSHALARQNLAGVSLGAACVTNITRAHVEQHNTVENYRRTKGRILDFLRSDGLAVFNVDDPVSMGLLSEVKCQAITVGIDRPADITATIVDRNLCDQTFLLNVGDETAAVRTRLLGNHNVSNCLEAAAIGLANGIDVTTIARGLEGVDRLAGRMERIDVGQEFAVFVDDARTPHALAAALGSLRQVTPGRVLCVFGSEGGEDGQERKLLARAAEQMADRSVVTTTSPYHEPPQWIAAEILDGFESSTDVEVIVDREKAIGAALDEALPGDTVLIAGRGEESYQYFGMRQARFDDRKIARAFLEQQNQESANTPWRTAA